MSLLLVVLFCCLVGAQSRCFQAPAGKLPDGCKVSNLTVTVDPSYEIINRLRCNITAGESFFNAPPRSVGFHYISGTIAPGYLLTAVDVTSKNLVWMVSNLTIVPDLKIVPFTNGRYSQEIMNWHKPQLNSYSRERVVEYLVFEEHRSYPSRTYTYSPSLHATPFNLSTWINSQQNSGIAICGPVAGGSVVAAQPLPAPAPAPSPNRPTSPPANTPPPTNIHHHHHHKSDSNRNLFNGILLAGVVLSFAILRF